MEKRGLRWWWRKWRREGMNEREKKLMFTLHQECRLLLLIDQCSVFVCNSLIWRLSPAVRGDSSKKMWHRH